MIHSYNLTVKMCDFSLPKREKTFREFRVNCMMGMLTSSCGHRARTVVCTSSVDVVTPQSVAANSWKPCKFPRGQGLLCLSVVGNLLSDISLVAKVLAEGD